MDFSWYRFICQAKLGLTAREAGRLTLAMFSKLYGHYKDTFDLELRIQLAGTTYAEAEAQAEKSEEWL